MRKAYIFSVEVDENGHEHDLKRECELVTCADCAVFLLRLWEKRGRGEIKK